LRDDPDGCAEDSTDGRIPFAVCGFGCGFSQRGDCALEIGHEPHHFFDLFSVGRLVGHDS
jgi:hypothetical protein